MVFVGLLLGTLLSLAIILCFHWLVALRKKKKLSFRDTIVPKFIDAGISLIPSLVLAFIIHFASGGIDLGNSTLLFATVTLLFLLFAPSKFFTRKENRPRPIRKKVILASLLGIGLLLDVFTLNYKAFSNYGVSHVENASSLISQNGKEKDGTKGQNEIKFDVDYPVKNVRFDFEYKDNVSLNVKVLVKDAASTKYSEYLTFQMDGKNVDFHIVKLPNASSFKFHFDFEDHYLQSDNIILKTVTFNAKPRVHFGLLRFASFAGILSLFAYSPNIIDFFKKRYGVNRIPYLVFGGLAIVGVLTATIFILAKKEGLMVAYPLSKENLESPSTDIYVALFDALRKGQPHLDITPDPKLVALPNPYDPSSRGGVTYLWDHAFYNGKYYSYYGALPVLLVSFPLYLLSGLQYVPNAFALEIVGMAMLIPAFMFLVLEIYRFTCKEVSWPSYVVLTLVSMVMAMMIMTMTFKDGYYHEAIYHVPDIYGLLFFDLFFAFVLRAYRQVKGRTRELALSGISFVFVIASRPNLVLGVVLALPFYFSMLIRREAEWKKKIIQFAPMVGILAVGAFVICLYNKVRFDSILEFGQSYQLNVTDQRHLTYSLDKLYPSFLHFFFQGPVFYNRFPFISASISHYSFDNCPYINGYFGTMLIPCFAAVFALPFIFWKKSAEHKIFGIIYPLFLILFAFTTYSKAGICARYFIEQYHLSTLGFLFMFLELSKRNENSAHYNVVFIGGVVFIAFSVFECLNLNFDGFDGMNSGDMNGLLLSFKQAFGSLNI